MTRLIPSAMQRPLAACLLGLCALAPARAQVLPPVILPVAYSTTVDMAAGIATFVVQFDRAPDLLSVDDVLRQADSFQFWTDTVSTDPIGSTYDGLFGVGPLGTQAVLTAVDIPLTGRMTYVWPKDATYTGPRDTGGWGQVQGDAAYTLAGDTVSFDVPLSILNSADGHFYYVFETFQYGGGGLVDYFGASGQDYVVGSVPEPSGAALLAAGIALLGVAARWRPAARSGQRIMYPG